MTTLLDRARAYATRSDDGGQLVGELVREVERLKKAVADIEAVHKDAEYAISEVRDELSSAVIDYSELDGWWRDATAERDRLAEALRHIDGRAQASLNAATNAKTIWAVRDIARAALKDTHNA